MQVWENELKNITWKGKQVIDIRQLVNEGKGNNLFALKNILLKENIFLTQDEIRYYTLKLRHKLITEDMNISLMCSNISEGTHMLEVNVDFNTLDYKDWNIGKSITIAGRNIISKVPLRDSVIDIDMPQVIYKVYEMNECLEGSSIEWLLELDMDDFKLLETFYNSNRFVFLPIVTAECKCGKLNKFAIDGLPNLSTEW